MKGLFGSGKKTQNPSKWTVQFDHDKCIGAGMCESIYPERWEVEGRKSFLKGSTKKGHIFELSVENDELAKMKAAAESCPKNAIHITNKGSGEKII